MYGLKIAAKEFVNEINIYFLHMVGVVKARRYMDHKELKLHIGCGSNKKIGWLNIDLYNNADINLDMRERLPFRDKTCSMIYAEHFLEHLDYPEPTKIFLKECFRLLESGGKISFGVPDTEWPILEYARVINLGYFNYAEESWHPVWCKTNMEHINYHFRQDGEHRFSYDYITLRCTLIEIGFVNVTRRQFNSNLDREDRRIGTLYIDAIKPIID